MFKKAQKFAFSLAALAAIAVGSAVIANAASDSATTSGPSAQTQGTASGDARGGAPGPGQGETALTGETADKVKAAALEKVPGGTVLRVETDADGSAYEAHVRKSDGTEVVVKVNEQFEATAVEEFDARRGGPGPGHPCDRDGDGNPDGPRGGGGSGSGYDAPPGGGTSGSTSGGEV